MQIGQFWRLLNFMRFLIMRFYCQKDSSYMTRNLLKEQDAEKSGSRTPGRDFFFFFFFLGGGGGSSHVS